MQILCQDQPGLAGQTISPVPWMHCAHASLATGESNCHPRLVFADVSIYWFSTSSGQLIELWSSTSLARARLSERESGTLQ